MTDISKAYKNKKAFTAFLTCGDPDIGTTEKCIFEMQENGASLIELGIPFSDPTAEGPVIMAADERALESGTTTDSVFEMLGRIKDRVYVPLVIMTYANVVFSYGIDEFACKAHENGISGLILPDVPFEHKAEFSDICSLYGIDIISLVAPTSDDRIKMIAQNADGFIYLVSSLGVTGMRSSINTDISSIVKKIRQYTSVPCSVGFGIKDPAQAREISKVCDGVIVGSAIVDIIAKYGVDSPVYVGRYVKRMTDAMN